MTGTLLVPRIKEPKSGCTMVSRRDALLFRRYLGHGSPTDRWLLQQAKNDSYTSCFSIAYSIAPACTRIAARLVAGDWRERRRQPCDDWWRLSQRHPWIGQHESKLVAALPHQGAKIGSWLMEWRPGGRGSPLGGRHPLRWHPDRLGAKGGTVLRSRRLELGLSVVTVDLGAGTGDQIASCSCCWIAARGEEQRERHGES